MPLVNQPHGYGPSLRTLRAAVQQLGYPQPEAWQHILAWARHRPAAWEVEDRRKKKGLAHTTPALGALLACELTWETTGDVGGELSLAYLDKTPPVKGALEATTSGLHLLKGHALPFPVFDWNSIPLKDRLENRFHVGDGVWPAFSHVTSLSLFGRRVLVIGYGPVGKGIAERARNLGAIVHVADLDPLRLLEARYHGCEVVTLEEGLAHCQVIVTATGVEGVLGEVELGQIRTGAILFNAGHSNREIDMDWLYRQPYQRLKAHIDRFDLGQTHLFLLARGSLLNLATGAGPHGNDLFDHYTAVMLLGLAWMFDGLSGDIQPGLQRYPAHLERDIAERSLRLHHQA